MDPELLELEAATVRAFVEKRYLERWLLGLGKRARRAKLLDRLSHHEDWNPKYARDLVVPSHREPVSYIVERLIEKGAPSTCHLVGGDGTDGSTLPLADAVRHCLDYGALLICLPGRLAVHLPEDGDAIVLERSESVGR